MGTVETAHAQKVLRLYAAEFGIIISGGNPSIFFINAQGHLTKMSWLDSSFSFAKTALSQAQKSIDRVLDIKEGGEGGQSEPAKPSG